MNQVLSMVDGGSGNWSDVVAAGAPAWTLVFDHVQLAFALIGVLANICTLITLTVNGEDFSDIIKMLFKYQSVLDCLCCLQACLLFTIAPMWKVGNTIFDTFICHSWHSQYFYWFNVDVSTYNLVTLALERYVCVCHPLKYMSMTKTHFRKIIVGFFLLAFFILSAAWFQTRMRDGECRSEFFWDGPGTARFFGFYSLVAFFYAYFIPCTFFFVLYGLVILQFRKRGKENLGAPGASNTINKASNELTKTAIIVTVIFIISLGFDIWYYLLAYLGVVPYILNSPIQKIGVFFSVFNVVANPFLYASFMPLYRKSVKKTFFFGSCTKAEFFWDGPGTARFFGFYSLVAFFYAYFIPCTFFFVLYGLVILQFRKRGKENLGAPGASNTINKASNELTKTAIIVTVIFIISLGFDIWYYLLAYLGVVPYILNSPIQKIGVFFSVFNVVANPFLYASFMPLYRKSVKKTFFFGSCTKAEFFWDGPGTARFFGFYSLVAFFYAYFIPCTFFFVLYGLVILQFRKRGKENLGAPGASNTTNKASNELTKTAIIVTVIFIISLGFDIWYYLLAYLGVVPYILNSPIQKIGVFFSVFNVVANPFLYASFMPLYRKSVKKTFFGSCTKA